MYDSKESITITKDFDGLTEAIQALAKEKGYQNSEIVRDLIHKVDLIQVVEIAKTSKERTGHLLPKDLKAKLSRKVFLSEKAIENLIYNIDWDNG